MYKCRKIYKDGNSKRLERGREAKREIEKGRWSETGRRVDNPEKVKMKGNKKEDIHEKLKKGK